MLLSRNPFRIWPLHVKLFTEEALRRWEQLDRAANVQTIALVDDLIHAGIIANRTAKSKRKTKTKSREASEDESDAPVANGPSGSGFPPHFTCTVELEGVDGLSGHHLGSGRTGPVDDKDEHFTTQILSKNTNLIASGITPLCAICTEPVADFAKNPLTTTLCHHELCSSVSHLNCLADQFIQDQSRDEVNVTSIVPRGGNCPSCHTYTLWGDIIRGCYRRSNGSSDATDDFDQELLEADATQSALLENELGGLDEMLSGLTLDTPGKRSKAAKPKNGKATAPKRPVGRPRKNRVDTSSGEEFDFSGITSTTSDSSGSERGKRTVKSRSKRSPAAPVGDHPAEASGAISRRAVLNNTVVLERERSPQSSDIDTNSDLSSTSSDELPDLLVTKKTASRSPKKRASRSVPSARGMSVASTILIVDDDSSCSDSDVCADSTFRTNSPVLPGLCRPPPPPNHTRFTNLDDDVIELFSD